MPAGRPTDYTPAMCDLLDATIPTGATLGQIAIACGVGSISTIKRWMEAHEEFRAAVTRVRLAADVDVESGWYAGACRGDPKLAPCWLANRQPSEWPGTSRVQVSGDPDAPVHVQVIDVRKLPDDALLALEAATGDCGEPT